MKQKRLTIKRSVGQVRTYAPGTNKMSLENVWTYSVLDEKGRTLATQLSHESAQLWIDKYHKTHPHSTHDS